jgi:hypothetical protein
VQEKKSMHYRNSFLCVDSVYCAAQNINTSYAEISGLITGFVGIIAAILMA